MSKDIFLPLIKVNFLSVTNLFRLERVTAYRTFYTENTGVIVWKNSNWKHRDETNFILGYVTLWIEFSLKLSTVKINVHMHFHILSNAECYQ